MLVTQHNIAIRSMDKALQHFKIDWSSCIRLTRSFESSLRGRRSKGKGRGIGAPKSPSPSPFNARHAGYFDSDLPNELDAEKRFLRRLYTKTRQSERVNNFEK